MHIPFSLFHTDLDNLIMAIDVHPKGNSLVVGHLAGTSDIALSLWSILDERQIAVIARGVDALPLAARFSPNGRYLAYTDAQQTLSTYDLSSARRQSLSLPFTKWISFAVEHDRLLAGGTQTQVWDMTHEEVIWSLESSSNHSGPDFLPPCCAISPDGKYVATSGVEQNCIVVYDIDTNRVVNRLAATMNVARTMAFDPTGRYVAAVADTLGVGLWEIETGKAILPAILNIRADFHWSLRFHPNGHHIAFGLWSGFVLLIDIRDGSYALRQDEPVHVGRVRDLAFTPDGTQMFSGGDDGVLLRWDLSGIV